MKVLEEGNKKPWSRKLRCTGKGFLIENRNKKSCGALLKITEEDLYYTQGDRHVAFGYSEPIDVLTFMCPQCTVETQLESVSKNVIPRGNRPSS